MIKVGDTLPATTLMEYSDVEGEGCSIGPNAVNVAQASAGKTIALFALPGAYTPTCSAKHVPGFVDSVEAFKAAGVDEIWCVSVNDAFVMGAWARDQKAVGKVPEGPGRPEEGVNGTDGPEGQCTGNEEAVASLRRVPRRNDQGEPVRGGPCPLLVGRL